MKTHTMNTKRLLTCCVMAALLMVGSSVTAFAAGETAEEAAASYGYRAGQQQNSDRHAQYVAGGSTDEDSEAYKVAQGINGDKYSGAQRLDAEELVAAGIIDQATADSIKAYGSARHDTIHARHDGMAGMTDDERHAFYAGVQSDGSSGDSVEELLEAGIITQARADAINAYLE